LASKYSGEDVYITYQLFCEQELSDIENKILNEIDLPFIEILKNMEITGVKICRDRLKEL